LVPDGCTARVTLSGEPGEGGGTVVAVFFFDGIS
jgi:hypothetical protein